MEDGTRDGDVQSLHLFFSPVNSFCMEQVYMQIGAEIGLFLVMIGVAIEWISNRKK